MKKAYCIVLAFDNKKDRDKYYNKKNFPKGVEIVHRPMDASQLQIALSNFLKDKETASNNKTD